MIAACPKCGARYRLERERLHAGSVRLRCARCEAVFRVRPPGTPESAAVAEPSGEPRREPSGEPRREPQAAAPVPTAQVAAAPAREPAAPAPAGDVVLVAMPDGDLARRTGALLAERGLRVLVACDGVEAMLEIQRKLPRAIVLSADLPKMYGFQICEVVKRNESLRGTWVVLVGAIHHKERYRRAPGELYGADAYVEAPELPAGLLPVLVEGGVPLAGVPARPPPAVRPPPPPVRPAPPPPVRPPAARAAPSPAAPAPRAEPKTAPPALPAPAPVKAAPRPEPARPPAAARPAPVTAPRPTPVVGARPTPVAPAAPARPPPAAPAPRRHDGLDEERAKAERLARIVISDIVLYNQERFAAAARNGTVLEAMASDLAEGRQLFEERIDARVRAERDHLKDELLRRAQARGAR